MFELARYILRKDLTIREATGYDPYTDRVKYFHGWCKASYVLKAANTLEELCDVFVIIFHSGCIAYEKDCKKLDDYIDVKVIYGAVRGPEGIMYVIQRLPNGSWKTVEKIKKEDKKRKSVETRN